MSALITALFTIAALFAAVTVILDCYVRGRTAYRELLERIKP